MNTDATRLALARAFRDVTFTLIGLFELYEPEADLEHAAAEALGKLFRSHLEGKPTGPSDEEQNPLHGLLGEMDTVAAKAA